MGKRKRKNKTVQEKKTAGKRQNKKAILAGAILVVAIAAGAFMLSIDPARKKFDRAVQERTFLVDSDFLYTYEITRYPSSAEVVELRSEKTLIGFDIDPDKMNFGSVPSNGSYSRKTINFTNIVEKDARISIQAIGEIAPYISIPYDNFRLRKGQVVEMEVLFHTRKDGISAGIGNYTGEINIIVQIPKNGIVYSFWDMYGF
jgi:hypothetical protein